MRSRPLRAAPPRRATARTWGAAAVGIMAAAGALLAGAVTSGAAAVPATATNYTWSGAASAAGTSTDWSVAGNWKGGAAPAAASTVNLNFPALKCTTVTNCGSMSTNDVTGLKVSKWTIGLENSAEGSTPGEYDFTGDAVALGNLTVESPPVVSGDVGNYSDINVPIHVNHNDTWKMETNSGGQPVFLKPITGTGSLAVTMNSPDGFADFDSTDNVGPVGIVGANATSPYQSGVVALYGSINTNGNPVGLTDVGFFVSQDATVGPLTTAGDDIQIGNGLGTGPYGIFAVDGALTLDSKSTFEVEGLTPGTGTKPVPGTTYTQITATGAAALNGATLGFFADCGQNVGTVYTLIAAKGGLTGTFGNAANGSVVQAQKADDSSCNPSTAAPYLKLSYNDTAGTLTAKVVAAPASPLGVVAPAAAGPTWQTASAGGASWVSTAP